MKGLRIAVLIAVAIIMSGQAQAIAVGANKAVISFQDVLKGGYAQDAILITTDSPQPLGVEYRLEGEIADWLSVQESNETLTTAVNNPARLTVVVQPPPETANGVYTGGVRIFTTIAQQDIGGRAGSTILSAVFVRLSVEITGEQIVRCNAGGFEIRDGETGRDLESFVTIENTGNVNIQPEMTINIWDQLQEELVETLALEVDRNILPTTTYTYRGVFNNNLDIDQYWADMETPLCGNSRTVTFSVLERGGVSDSGELVRIENQAWAETNDIIPIKGIFKNTGKTVVEAKLKGTITLNGKVAKVIDTDPINVQPGDTAELETFFQPQESGQYMVNARVLYNNKLTFPKTSPVNVNPGGEYRVGSQLNFAAIMVLVVILGIITALLVFIRKKKKAIRKKL